MRMLWAGTNQINMTEGQPVQQETREYVYNTGNLGATIQQGQPEPIPTAVVNNKIRQINIEEVSRGYIVRVGCQTYAIETRDQLISKLSEYINEPEKTEQKWFKNELF